MTDQELAYSLMGKLTKNDYKETYYTVAELRPEDAMSNKVVYVILPVDVYIKEGMGYEIMPVEILAKNCPWDMTKTIVKIKSRETYIMENLHDIVVEDAELHKYLKALDS